MEPIINKVAQKAVVNIDPATFIPAGEQIVVIDLKDFLFKGLILREADFRAAVKQTDWSVYRDQYVVLHCSSDAIIPNWAYMILAAELALYATDVVNTIPAHAREVLMYRAIDRMDMTPYIDQRVIIKGCGDEIPAASYTYLTMRLAPVVRAINYGESCSMVPVSKRSMD
jgi:Protein of unknown function (DUF2480)